MSSQERARDRLARLACRLLGHRPREVWTTLRLSSDPLTWWADPASFECHRVHTKTRCTRCRKTLWDYKEEAARE